MARTALPDFGDTFEVVASRGEPTVVIVPERLWKRLPAALRRGYEDCTGIVRGKVITARLIPLDRFDALREPIEDLLDVEIAEAADAEIARERAVRARAGAGPGIPSDVVGAELGGIHPIAAWRKHRGMTQAQLAEAIGMDRGYLALLERGARSGSPETLGKLARALGCLVDDLIPAAAD